jgi:hypothetical protein
MSPGGRSPLRGTTSATAEIASSCRRGQCSTADAADTRGVSKAGVTVVSPARAAARSGGGVGGRDARITADAHDHRPGLHPPCTTKTLHLSCWYVSRWGRKGCRGGWFGTRQWQAVELCEKRVGSLPLVHKTPLTTPGRANFDPLARHIHRPSSLSIKSAHMCTWIDNSQQVAPRQRGEPYPFSHFCCSALGFLISPARKMVWRGRSRRHRSALHSEYFMVLFEFAMMCCVGWAGVLVVGGGGRVNGSARPDSHLSPFVCLGHFCLVPPPHARPPCRTAVLPQAHWRPVM